MLSIILRGFIDVEFVPDVYWFTIVYLHASIKETFSANEMHVMKDAIA